VNRKQEIAAWIVGLLVAMVLFVTGNGIWALVVLAGLTILSLQNHQKNKQKSTIPISSKSNEPVQPDFETILKNVTPHSLAAGILQLVHKSPESWKTPDTEIPQEADEAVMIACECYELRIFLDLLQQRFGAGIAKLVEASFSSLMDDVKGLKMFSRVSSAILRARALGPAQVFGPAEDGPNNAQLRLDVQVADQYLNVFSYSTEDPTKAELRFPLAESLSHARIWAEHLFSELVFRIDFDPLSVAIVARETESRGV
jgi:hypothetical protein